MRRPLDARRHGSALVAAVALLVSLPSLSGALLFDDEAVFRDNPLLGSHRLGDFFAGNMFGSAGADLLFRPLLMLSLRLDRALFDHHALPMHAVNAMLHALCAVLFFRVLLALVDDEWSALLGALLFAVHPVHVDAVAFVVNRSEMLAFAALALGLLALVRDPGWRAFVRGEPASGPARRWPLIAAALALVAALGAKEMAAGALPVLAVLLAVRAAERRRPPPSVLAGSALLLAAFAVYLAARRAALGALVNPAAAAWIQDRQLRVLAPTAARIFADYLRWMLVPYPMRVDHTGYAVSAGPLEPVALLAFALHAAVLGGAAWLVRRRPSVTLAVLGFYAALAPVSQLFPIREIEAERFLYLPSAFLCGLAGTLLPRRTGFLLVALLGVLFLNEAAVRRSGETLWRTMVARAPDNPVAQYNLGTVEMSAGRYDRAIAHFESAVHLRPADAHGWTNLGECRVAVGDDAGAGAAFRVAVRLDDASPRAHRNLAVYLALHGDREGARRELERARALGLDPASERAVGGILER